MAMPQRRRIDLPARQWLWLALVLGGFAAAGSLHFFAEYRAVEAREYERLAVQAAVIDKNLAQQLAATALALDAIRREVPANAAAAGQLSRRLIAMSDAMPGVRALLYLDATGKVLASDREQLIGQRFDQRAYFQLARQGGDPKALYVSPPFRTVLGVFTLTVSKVVLDARGQFAGVVTASLDPDYIMPLLDSVRYADDMRVTVTHDTGALFLSAPMGSQPPPATTDLIAQGALQPRHLGMDSPLHVTVARAQRSVFAEWRRHVGIASGTFALLGLAAVLSLVWYQRQIARLATARNAAEQALEQSEARWRFALEGAGDGVWDWNMQTGAAFFSRRYHEILGHTDGEFAPRADEWMQRVHPDDIPAVSETLRRYLEGQAPALVVEFRMRCKNGDWKWLHGRGMLVERDAAGQPLRMVGTNTDITERKRAEQELKLHRDELSSLVANRTVQLEAAMQSLLDAHDALAQSEARATLSTMIASVTHELSTPIANSTLTAEHLSECTRAFATQVAAGRTRRSELEAYAATMLEGTTLMQRNLLRARELLGHFKQVAADQASEQRRQFDLAHEVGEVVAALMPSLGRQPHRIAIEIPPGIGMNTLPGALGQVVINLINNAYLHAFEGRQDGLVTITATAHGETLCLCVSDNGKGIAEEHMALIFKPFFSTKIGRGGTGLGMAIIENLVRRTLCGTLQVRSALNVGTTVEIMLPRELPEPATALPAGQDQPAELPPN